MNEFEEGTLYKNQKSADFSEICNGYINYMDDIIKEDEALKLLKDQLSENEEMPFMLYFKEARAKNRKANITDLSDYYSKNDLNKIVENIATYCLCDTVYNRLISKGLDKYAIYSGRLHIRWCLAIRRMLQK